GDASGYVGVRGVCWCWGRRRESILVGYWSSDWSSSDLPGFASTLALAGLPLAAPPPEPPDAARAILARDGFQTRLPNKTARTEGIGRASCRERKYVTLERLKGGNKLCMRWMNMHNMGR